MKKRLGVISSASLLVVATLWAGAKVPPPPEKSSVPTATPPSTIAQHPATRPTSKPSTFPTSKPVAEVNKICPVTKDDVDPNGPFRTYQGKKIIFCCTECAEQFDQDPERIMESLR